MFSLHPYATDSDERDKIVPYVGVVSIATVFVIHVLLDHWGISVPWWLDMPSPIVLYFAMRRLLDVALWRSSFLRTLGLVSIPDLNGRWVGWLRSNATDGMKTPCEVVIRQTWTTIGIVLETATSRSANLVAGILVDSVYDAELQYDFLNEPKANAPGTMEKHRGSVTLNLEVMNGSATLTGDYFTGRGRSSHGELHLRREES